jgi:hypothetical protein
MLAAAAQRVVRPAPKEAGCGVDDRGNPLFDSKRTNPDGTLFSLLKGKLPYGMEVDLNDEKSAKNPPRTGRQSTLLMHLVSFSGHTALSNSPCRQQYLSARTASSALIRFSGKS